jgi:hypothetical protein
MTNRPSKFSAADIRRAVKIANEAGKIVELVPDGTIRIRDADPAENPASGQDVALEWPDSEGL